MIQQEMYDILRRTRDELEAGKFALSRVLTELYVDADVYQAARASGVTSTELERCAGNLEIAFILRIFAEFEAILGDYWRNGLGKRTKPDMYPLMNSIARRRKMSDSDLAHAHEVREYRNDIIHKNVRSDDLDFPQCLRAIGVFLKWLPLRW